jgi:hypothetical protein
MSACVCACVSNGEIEREKETVRRREAEGQVGGRLVIAPGWRPKQIQAYAYAHARCLHACRQMSVELRCSQRHAYQMHVCGYSVENTYIHTYILQYIYIYIYIYTHTYIIPYYIQTTYIYVYIYIYIYIYTCTYIYTYLCMHIHIYVYTYIYIYIHTNTNTRGHKDENIPHTFMVALG